MHATSSRKPLWPPSSDQVPCGSSTDPRVSSACFPIHPIRLRAPTEQMWVCLTHGHALVNALHTHGVLTQRARGPRLRRAGTVRLAKPEHSVSAEADAATCPPAGCDRRHAQTVHRAEAADRRGWGGAGRLLGGGVGEGPPGLGTHVQRAGGVRAAQKDPRGRGSGRKVVCLSSAGSGQRG